MSDFIVHLGILGLFIYCGGLVGAVLYILCVAILDDRQ